jgi:hypothetical protein
MLRWAFLLGILAPASAWAAPPVVLAGPPIGLAAASAPAASGSSVLGIRLQISLATPPTGGAQPRFAPLAPTDLPGDTARSGWGLFATMPGHSLAITGVQMSWTPDANARPHEVQAGYGWRNAQLQTVIGYAQYDLGPRSLRYHPGTSETLHAQPREETIGVLGLGLRMRTR